MTDNDTNEHSRLVDQLCRICGILPEYWDIKGINHPTSKQTAVRLLEAMGVNCGDALSARQSLDRLHRESWEELTEPVIVGEEGEAVPLKLRLPSSVKGGKLSWKILLEDGRPGGAGELDTSMLESIETVQIDGKEQVLLGALLPVSLNYGCHELYVWRGGKSAESSGAAPDSSSLLIISPAKCYLPEEASPERKIWGISTQLYGLSSGRNWGIGDFSDLNTFSSWAKAQGADFVGINPLHAVSPRGDGGISPYSPVSRLVLNALYIDLDAAVEMLSASPLKSQLQSAGFAQGLARLREKQLVPYHQAAQLKFDMLERLYGDFCRRHLKKPGSFLARVIADLRKKQQKKVSPQGASFLQYKEQAGAGLHAYAVFAALEEHFTRSDSQARSWQSWPQEYHRPENPAVIKFSLANAERVDFYKFVQWLAHTQLLQVQQSCREKNMAVGLYLDVALGAAGGGAEAWVNQDLYAFKASMGAPPDKLAPQGQDWGLPPFIPSRLRKAGYRPFREMLRASMQYSGALRLDHVMSLMRLYWVPGPGEAKNGAYVLYKLDELAALVAIESRRNKCLVIGEDLGTVPPEVRAAMERRGMLSYKVFYFMKDYAAGSFLAPQDYSSRALVVTSTHDLPTLKGYWEGEDLAVRAALKLHDEEVIKELRSERMADRAILLKALNEAGLLKQKELQLKGWSNGKMPPRLNRRVHRFLARTPSVLQVVQLEDIVGQKEQANLPGTISEHDNWQRKLPLTLEQLQQSAHVRRLLRLIDHERKLKAN